jgi:hypothetical protein
MAINLAGSAVSMPEKNVKKNYVTITHIGRCDPKINGDEI